VLIFLPILAVWTKYTEQTWCPQSHWRRRHRHTNSRLWCFETKSRTYLYMKLLKWLTENICCIYYTTIRVLLLASSGKLLFS